MIYWEFSAGGGCSGWDMYRLFERDIDFSAKFKGASFILSCKSGYGFFCITKIEMW